MGKGIRGLVMREVRRDVPKPAPLRQPVTTIGYTAHDTETPIAYRCDHAGCGALVGELCREAGKVSLPHELRKAKARAVYNKARSYVSRSGPKAG